MNGPVFYWSKGRETIKEGAGDQACCSPPMGRGVGPTFDTAIGASRQDHLHYLQSGWPFPGHRQLGFHGADLGRGHGKSGDTTPEAPEGRHGRPLQPGWTSTDHRG